MNLLYEPFPNCVEVNGRWLRIVTDYRDWLKFYDMLRDGEMEDSEKFELMLTYYLDEFGIGDIPAMQAPLLSFYQMKETQQVEEQGEDSEREPGKPVYDFAFDAQCIISDFFREYRIDLTSPRTRMHWWRFMILLCGLSKDAEFKQRVAYRSTDAGQIKDVNERQRIQRIQRKIAIPTPAPTDYEIGDLFW